MTYKVNGTPFSMQPTEGKWLSRDQLGTSGTGHPIYSNVRQFEITWNLVSPSEYGEIVGFFDSVGVTGTLVVDLPKWGASTYTFESYTGCVLLEPSIANYYNENLSDVSLIVARIRT